eukprot:2804441-Pleurochrysis_carterae.AAC.1
MHQHTPATTKAFWCLACACIVEQAIYQKLRRASKSESRVSAYTPTLSLPKWTLLALEETFKSIDLNGNGTVSFDEFTQESQSTILANILLGGGVLGLRSWRGAHEYKHIHVHAHTHTHTSQLNRRAHVQRMRVCGHTQVHVHQHKYGTRTHRLRLVPQIFLTLLFVCSGSHVRENERKIVSRELLSLAGSGNGAVRLGGFLRKREADGGRRAARAPCTFHEVRISSNLSRMRGLRVDERERQVGFKRVQFL